MDNQEKNEALETSKMFFHLPLERMLSLMDQLNLEDHEAIVNAAPFSLNWISAFRRRESRFNLMEFRLNFEVGNGALLNNGQMESNADVAKDLFQRGWIDENRFKLAQAGKYGEDFALAMGRLEQNKKELQDQLTQYRKNGVHIHDDGSVSLVPEESNLH